MHTDILTLISEKSKEFSRGQKKIARFITDSFDKAAFMTAGKLAEIVEVSESTVVRFAADIGYPGYPEMRRALQDVVRSRLTSVQRIEVTKDALGTDQDILNSVLRSDADNIRFTLDSVDREAFRRAVTSISNARRVFILGVRTSAALASFLGFYLNLLLDNVKVLGENDEIQISRVAEDDVFIGISFPRYSHRTVRALRAVREKGSEVIALTDTEASPIAKIANVNIFAKSDMVSFADSLVAPLSVINALIVSIGLAGKDALSARFEEFEKLWNEYEVYEK
ncbi:MAG: MurR/RpiR family transcriptional regulator [Oscillospiraceae bacterium]|jgi:DNA-binding MurR/RpiR family transcriptional regulator|nr:MurR/RpiR family transcriptional regulator [Oscillospiraceae bacterium]